MKEYTYKVIIDGKEMYSGNRIKYLKEKAQFDFDYLNAYSAVIVRGNQLYAHKTYDGGWMRMTGPYRP